MASKLVDIVLCPTHKKDLDEIGLCWMIANTEEALELNGHMGDPLVYRAIQDRLALQIDDCGACRIRNEETVLGEIEVRQEAS